jgi:hypothetical protein
MRENKYDELGYKMRVTVELGVIQQAQYRIDRFPRSVYIVSICQILIKILN